MAVAVCEDAGHWDPAGSEHSPWEWAEMDPLAAGGRETQRGQRLRNFAVSQITTN